MAKPIATNLFAFAIADFSFTVLYVRRTNCRHPGYVYIYMAGRNEIEAGWMAGTHINKLLIVVVIPRP